MLEPGERQEDLFQLLKIFTEVNLLKSEGGIHHHSELMEPDEELSPSLETFFMLTWLRPSDKNLHNVRKQWYGTELQSRMLASLKPEISQALDR